MGPDRSTITAGPADSLAVCIPVPMKLIMQKRSDEWIRRFLTEQSKLDFSYRAVGATANSLPAGFVVDHTRIRLGEGESLFQAGKAAMQAWRQFDLGWVEARPSDTPIRTGEVVAIVARVFGMWTLNVSKIVYVVAESGRISRFGFAYGTLPAHAERGEERFLIEWDQGDNSVWYDILAFSRPNCLLTWLGYPFVRRTQKRFGRDSAAAMLRACQPTRRASEGD
jgi:uncharacterized protein (UPF0548 family)